MFLMDSRWVPKIWNRDRSDEAAVPFNGQSSLHDHGFETLQIDLVNAMRQMTLTYRLFVRNLLEIVSANMYRPGCFDRKS